MYVNDGYIFTWVFLFVWYWFWFVRLFLLFVVCLFVWLVGLCVRMCAFLCVLTPNSQFVFRAGMSLNIHSFVCVCSLIFKTILIFKITYQKRFFI